MVHKTLAKTYETAWSQCYCNTSKVFLNAFTVVCRSYLHHFGVNIHDRNVNWTPIWCSHSCKNLHFFSVTCVLLGTPIPDWRVLGNYPKNNCGTHFGSSYLIVSKVANLILVVMSHITYIIQSQTCQVCVTQVWCENASLGWVGACRLLYESEQIRRDCTAKKQPITRTS